jgi:hypothetical protein
MIAHLFAALTGRLGATLKVSGGLAVIKIGGVVGRVVRLALLEGMQQAFVLSRPVPPVDAREPREGRTTGRIGERGRISRPSINCKR